MISKDWAEFNKYIKIIDKDLSEYEDDEGNYAILPTGNLLCGVQYNELTAQQLQVAIFEQKIPKDMKLETKEVNRAVNKKEITGKDEDKYTLVDKPETVHMVWFIVDGMKNLLAFNNKEKALEVAKAHNKKILSKCRKCEKCNE